MVILALNGKPADTIAIPVKTPLLCILTHKYTNMFHHIVYVN